MNNSDTDNQFKDYNNIPVLYCKHCLSLKIRSISGMGEVEYCDECGSSSIEECSIEEWETLYKNKYGHKFLEKY